ncbi:MAG: tripartite tricarboxylate transporter TctB family protein [Chloroflexota bacterium]
MKTEEQVIPKSATGLFYAVMFVFGVSFLLLLPYQTKPGPEGQGWWTQPALMPTISLWLTAITATYLLFQYIVKNRKQPADEAAPSGSLAAELIQWAKPVEFFVYYVGYIWLLGIVGYFLSSLIFIIVLSIRVGLTSARWFLTGLLFAISLILIFRWGLSVWVPPAELYDMFGKDTRIFLMRYF